MMPSRLHVKRHRFGEDVGKEAAEKNVLQAEDPL